MEEDRSFLLSSTVILFFVGLGQIVYGIILIPIVPAIPVQIGALCVVLLGVFFVINAVIDYMQLPPPQSR
jgi:hypothetical protein